ncbi:molecular chaperone GroEL [Thalassovita sp.]|uniref:molecular chaperone GroEL n=1 Tax=Thalassovita sp. TaxID=1979401 RepID=UPI003B58EE8A
MTDFVENFFAAWGEPDADTRADALRNALAASFSYQDPRMPEPTSDPEELIGYVAMYTQAMPGATAQAVHQSRTGACTRASVEFAMPDGNKQLGQYFIEHDAAGKLTRLIGFAGMGTSA